MPTSTATVRELDRWANQSMRVLNFVLLLFAMACTRHPHYDSQAKLLVRWIVDPKPQADWPSLRTKITSEDFAQFSLRDHPELAAAISESEIRIPPDSQVVVISVSATTPRASLEGVRVLIDAVTSAARELSGPFNVAVIEEPALLK
jgi:hypothetical protein